MNQEEFQSLINTATFEGEPLEASFEETHISWIAFSKSHVFKIKKPVKLSFLNFTSLDLRRRYCELELKLNQRFSSIYLKVLPVREGCGRWFLEGREGDIRDYAVLMERMDSSLRMDKMLHANKVKVEAIQALAQEVAVFHEKARVVRRPFNYQAARHLFNDLGGVAKFVEEQLGKRYADLIAASTGWSDSFLDFHQKHIQDRIDKGYQRDVHGDLHAGNIFLYPKPVLFDCIEFNEEFRQIDLLYEVAFLCMELEMDGHEELASVFVQDYTTKLAVLDGKKDASLFNYYKCLRANIRAKVKAISLMDNHQGEASTEDLKAVANYLSLMDQYIRTAPTH